MCFRTQKTSLPVIYSTAVLFDLATYAILIRTQANLDFVFMGNSYEMIDRKHNRLTVG